MAMVNEDDLYTELFQQVTKGPWLRSRTGTISCKYSAIQYIIIHYLINKIGQGIVTKENILDIIRFVLETMSDGIAQSMGAHLPLHRFKQFTPNERKLYEVITNYGSSKSDAMRGELSDYGTEITGAKTITDDIVYAGLVRPSSDNPNQLIIDHYFLIVKNGDGTFNIVSSYGSDRVSIIQNSILLDMDEFDEFVRALNVIKTERITREYTIEKSRSIIRNFMKKYFLSEESFRKTTVDPNNTGGRTHTNVRLIVEEAELYATPSRRGEYSVCSYNIVPTLYDIVERKLAEFSGASAPAPAFAPGGFGTFGVPGASVPSGGFGAIGPSGFGPSGFGSSASGASAENERMNMGGGNKKKHKTRKHRKHNRKSNRNKRNKSKAR